MNTPEKSKPRMLWVDDDGRGRFELECVILEEEYGVQLDWAETVASAALLLKQNVYDAIILDQMLAELNVAPTLVPWAGCALFLWLRRSTSQPWGAERTWASLDCEGPASANVRVPVVFVSGLNDEQVWEATRAADPSVALLGKPLDVNKLVEFIGVAIEGARGLGLP